MGKNQDDSSEPTQHKSSTSPIHKKPLTPTKDHPLMDLERQKPTKNEFMDDSDEADDDVDVVLSDDIKADAVGSNDKHINEINHIPPEKNNYPAKTITTSNPDDETNNNSNHQIESDDEMEKGKLAPEKVVKRRKSPSRTNNNNANVKNNNRMSYPAMTDRTQPRIEDALSKSTTDKIDGESNSFMF